MDKVMIIEKPTEFSLLKKEFWGIWLTEQKFGIWKQGTAAVSRNFKGRKYSNYVLEHDS